MNPKSDSAYILRWSKKIRAIRILGGKCVSCGKSDIRFLEFHHKNPSIKENNLSFLVDGRWSKIEKEIKKCVLLCKNCHSEFHCKGSSRLNDIKIKLLELRGQKECSKCGYVGKNFGSLDFHHRDGEKKDFAIGNAYRFITDMMPKVVSEIHKCDVICKNCHNIRHNDHERFNLFEKEIINRVNNPKEENKSVSKEIVLKQYRLGKTQKEIAADFGCAKSTISIILSKMRIKRTKKILPEKIKICPSCKKEFKCFGKEEVRCKIYCNAKCKANGSCKLNIPKKELIKLLRTETYSSLSRKFNVVHNTVRNLAKKYGLIG